MKDKPKRDVEAELKKIFSYHREGDDLEKINIGNQSTAWKKLAILFFAAGFLLSLIWGGFLLLGRSSTSGDDIKITFDGPEEIEPMKEYDIKIILTNVGTMDLARVSFELDAPEQFFATSSDPQLDERGAVQIGNLMRKEKREINLRGKFLLKEGETANLTANVIYHPQKFNATFEGSESYSVKVTEGVFTGSIEGPDKLLSGDEAEFTISLAKKIEEPIADLAISLEAPSDFFITTSTVQPIKDNVWPATFKNEAIEGRAIFKGKFNAEASGERVLKFLLGQMHDGKFFAIKELPITIEVLGAELSIDLGINGLPGQEVKDVNFMRFGDMLSYTIDVTNTSKEILKNIRVRFHVAGEPQYNGETVVMWPTAVESPDATRDGNTLVWTASEIGSFKNFKPTTSEHLEGNLRLRPGPFPIAFGDYRLRLWVEVELDGVGKIVQKRTLTSKIINIVIQSDTEFGAEARYFDRDGVALSTGPLPPKVNEQTTYRVFWRVKNSLHELNNVIITAPLGEHVILTGRNLIPAGVFSYDSANKMATWSLDKWSSSIKNMEISFEVGLTPTSEDVGQMPVLTGPATLKARDVITGSDINLVVPSLTTSLPNDTFAQNKSTVTE